MNRSASALTALVFAGCGGHAAPGPTEGSANATYTVNVTVEDHTTASPLAGATACVLGSSTACATADPNGFFTFSNIAAQGSGFAVSFSGFLTENFPLYLDGTAEYGVTLWQSTIFASDTLNVGASYDSSMGSIVFAVEDGSGDQLSGATVSTSPAGTVIYMETATAASATLTATAGYGGLVVGIPPGTANVTITTGAVCRRAAGIGWPPTMAGATTAVPIVAGELTRVHAACF